MLTLIIGLSSQIVLAEENAPLEKNGVILELFSHNGENGQAIIKGRTSNEKIKILISKDEYKEWYDVNLANGEFKEKVWLTEGKGEYTIFIMVHIKDRKYSVGPSIKVVNNTEVNKNIVNTKHVESDNPQIIQLSKKIAEGKKTDREKAQAIYNWIYKNISYDYEKYSKHLNNDYNNQYGALNTLKMKKGVCYDYSALTAALGRAAGLETKMIKGIGKTKSNNGLHAWNEIYISEENTWISVDTTFASTSGKNYFDNDDFAKDHVKESEY